MKEMFCTECGSALNEHGKCTNPACTNYAETPPPTQEDTGNPFWRKITFLEKGKMIVPECTKADIGEVPIKQYDIARLQSVIKGAFAEGRLQVTNKRVLFRACGTSLFGATSLLHEFSIDEIAGVEIRKEARFNFLATVIFSLVCTAVINFLHPIFLPVYNNATVSAFFSVLLLVANVCLFFALRKKPGIRFAVMTVLFAAQPLSSTAALLQSVLGNGNKLYEFVATVGLLTFIISLIRVAFAPNLVIRIVTKGGSPSMEIRRKDGFFSFQHNEYTGFSQVMPGPDANLAIQELGAIIREVQQTGSYSGQ